MIRDWRDWQSAAYLIGLPILVGWCWNQPAISWVAYGAILILSIGICCINHNHAHLPIWRTVWLNRFTDLWIGILQGHPVFLFQPAHIASHHRYNQGVEDVTRVVRHTGSNHLLGYLLFPLQVLPAISALKKKYIKTLWHEERQAFWWVVVQHLSLAVLWSIVFIINPYKALVYIVLPQFFGLHFLLASNYLQHAHATPGSRYNHSRNFVGPINWILLNVGYHTAHHEHATLHWTLLPAVHRDISPHIHPTLNEPSLGRYLACTLVLGMFFPRLRSQPIAAVKITGR